MAHYVTTIESSLTATEAFAYMADFSNAREWDPSVSEARLLGGGPVELGSEFDLVAKFAGRDVPLRYRIVSFEPPRLVVLEAERPGFTSRDTITVEPMGEGSTVRYDATLAFQGVRRLLDPLMQVFFSRTGAKADAGMRAALNP